MRYDALHGATRWHSWAHFQIKAQCCADFLLGGFLASLALNFGLALRDPGLLAVPALLLGWYLTDLLSGLIHMYMDYRSCRPGLGLDTIFYYTGSRESEEYQQLFRERMARLSPFERISYDFKNHHPRPDALGRRGLWRLIGSTVMPCRFRWRPMLPVSRWTCPAGPWGEFSPS